MKQIVTIILVFVLLGLEVLAGSFPQLLGVLKTDTVNTIFGSRIIPLGDQNGDGFDDILISQEINPRNSLFYGGSPFDTLSSLVFNSTNNRTNCIGDVNNDGYCDFTALGRTPFEWKLNLYLGGPSIDTVRDLWFGLEPKSAIGFTVLGGDINKNGTNEIITWEGLNFNSVLFFELGADSDSIADFELFPAYDTLNYKAQFGRGIITGDYNGDGIRDLAVSYNPRSSEDVNGSVYMYWGGDTFDTIPDLILRRLGDYISGAEWFGRILENLGDVNGDGYDDIFASSGAAIKDLIGFVYYGGPTIDTIPDVIIPTHHNKARAAGDVNNDGYQDLIVSEATNFSSIGWVEIFLGGLQMDSIPDVRFDVRDEARLHSYYGLDCSGIGDFNGDGIDDFAFSSRRGLNEYVVYIYSGWDTGTDIEIEYEENIPSDYVLSQNYPNPFNPSTTIEFSLPTRNHVALKVFNITGHEVAVLINKTLSAGSFKVKWDSHDSDGNEVASGVYFYKLETSDFVETKKMVLVR